MAKSIPLGHRLRYPITIVQLLKSPGDTIKKQEPVMQYSFTWMTEVGDTVTGDTWEEKQTSVVDWDSPADGKLKEWSIKVGEVIHRDRNCMNIEEACSHEIQFNGLCAICGKDMTEVNWAAEQTDVERAPINMTHDQTSLTVSGLQAARVEHELQRRLLNQRKLSLVVDLDQTIIHACIEPTVGEWQRDPQSPNYEAVKDVQSFQLNDDAPRGLANSCWYYIKMRPGLIDFLDRISEMYELHVYTMGTRAYALNIAKIVDPQQKLFGNRVISRDENGNMTAKSLQRLFPVSTNMVVIIDDRADVWPRNRPNLIKVTPYDFFKGVGDINSSFLPKREDQLPTPPPETPAKNGIKESQPVNGAPNDRDSSKISALEGLANMSSGDDTALLRLQSEEQEKELEKQLKERPLLHMQEKLDKEDEEAERNSQEAGTPNGESVTPSQPRHHLLLDDDNELVYLEQHLTDLHNAFFEVYDAQRATNPPVSLVPDVGEVLDRMKAKVLQGTTIVLSGLVPLGVDVLKSEIGMQVMSFGAELHSRVSKRVTHLVISSARPRTQKVRQAVRIPSIKIVNQDWLMGSLSRWTKLDEKAFLIDIHPADRALAPAPGTTEAMEADTVSDEDTDDVETGPNGTSPKPRKSKIIISGADDIAAALNTDTEDEDDDDDAEDEDNQQRYGLGPGETTPVTDMKFDWGEIDDEMAEFLASGDTSENDEDDDEDEDKESESRGEEAGAGRDLDLRGSKRKHDDDDAEADVADGEAKSSLAKKQRIARNRGGSGLKEVRTPEPEPEPFVDPNGEDLPKTPQEEDLLLLRSGAMELPAKDSTGDYEEDEQDENDLEADLLAELEAEEDEAEKLKAEKG